MTDKLQAPVSKNNEIVTSQCLGNGDRSGFVHRMSGLCGRLRHGKQHWVRW